MNPEKASIKIFILEEIGRRMEEMEEQAANKIHSHEGGKQAFNLASAKIADLMSHIDKDIQEGALQEIIGEPLLVADYAKKYLKRAIGVVDNLATAAEISSHVARGKRDGLDQAKEFAHKQWKAEIEKLEALKKALESGELVVEDGSAGHPGPSLKSQRLAEEQLPEEPAEKPAKKKRRGRPKKSDTMDS